MKTQFKTKDEIQFTTKNSTTIFNEVIKVKFQSVTIYKESVAISGFWYFTKDNVDKKIDDLSIQISIAFFKHKEFMAGKINVIDIDKYVDKRLEQLFPLIIDEDTSKISKPSSNLKGIHLELI